MEYRGILWYTMENYPSIMGESSIFTYIQIKKFRPENSGWKWGIEELRNWGIEELGN